MEFSLSLAMAPAGAALEGAGRAALLCPFDASFAPSALTPGCLPVLTDAAPYSGQSAEAIAAALAPILDRAPAVLLDFQREPGAAVRAFVRDLQARLPCPVVPPPAYAGEDGPVFLPPVPPDTPPEAFLAPWQGRGIWLDLGGGPEVLTLTPSGCRRESWEGAPSEGFESASCCCHYKIEAHSQEARFFLWRTGQDLRQLARRCQNWGVTGFVGLYPELRRCGFLNEPPPPGADR